MQRVFYASDATAKMQARIEEASALRWMKSSLIFATTQQQIAKCQ